MGSNQKCRKAAGSIGRSMYFPETEIRTPEVDQQYKFKEEVRNKLWILFRKSMHLGVVRHIFLNEIIGEAKMQELSHIPLQEKFSSSFSLVFFRRKISGLKTQPLKSFCRLESIEMHNLTTMKTTFLIAIFTLLAFSCKQESESQPTTDLTLNEKSAKIIAADNQFGLELFQKINSSLTEQKNTMISPMSISLALGMLYNGTDGNTKAQLETMLHKSGLTPNDINQNYKDLVSSLTSHDPKVELSISNGIFYRNTFPIKSDFTATNQNYYEAEVAGLDFTKTTETLNKVNGWVNSKTKGKIDKIINQVNTEDVMYILNAIYFNGEWKYRFDSQQTSNQNFTKEDNFTIQVPTMTIENKFNYYGDQNFEMLEMPYGSGKFSMMILLPRSGKKTSDVISALTTNNLTEWISKLTETKKTVYLPKFEFKFDKSLINNLQALGMTDAFDATKANLTGISDAAKLVVSEVMHKSYIKVDEKGTEAAAVTGITVGVTSVGPDLAVFRADHSFVFLIREKDTNSILFIGKVTDPSKS